MKKILLILGLFGSLVQAANPIISYVQLSTGATQNGGFNVKTGNVANSLALPFIGPGTQCVRSVNGAISGTGQDCGAGAVASGSNTIVASPQYEIPFYSQTGTSNTLTGASGFLWYGSSAQVTGTFVSSGPLQINSAQGIFFYNADNIGIGTTMGLDPFGSGTFNLNSPNGLTINGQDARGIAALVVQRSSNTGPYAAIAVADNTAGTGHYSGFSSTSGITTDNIWTLPIADGTTGQAMVTDGAKHLAFRTISGGSGGGGLGGTIVASPQFQVPYYSVAGTTTTVSGASGISVNGAGNTLTAAGLAAGNLTATGAEFFSGPMTLNPSATITSGTTSQLFLNTTLSPPASEGINFQNSGSSQGNYHQRNYNTICSDLSTSCYANPQAFDSGSGDQFFMNSGGRFFAMPPGSTANAYSSVIGGSLIVGGTSSPNYTDIQNVGDGNLFVNHGVIASSVTLNGSGSSLRFSPFTASSATINGNLRAGNFNNVNVSSMVALQVISSAPYYGSADNGFSSIYGEYNGPVTGITSDFNAVVGNFFNTDNGNVLADANGSEGNAVDVFPGKNMTLNGGQFYVQGRGYAPNYIGIYDRATWTSTPPGVTTTTSAITGLFVGVNISSGDFTTPVFTNGPAYSIYINPKTGGGAPGRSYSLLSYDTDPSFLSGGLFMTGSLQVGTTYQQFNTALSIVASPSIDGYDAVFSTSIFYNNGNAAVTISSNAAIAIESTDNTPLAIYRALQSSPSLQLLDTFDYLGNLQLTATGAVLNLAGNYNQGYGGMDLQNVYSTSNTFTRGMVSSNLIWSNVAGQWFSSGNGGNDYATMLFRQSGDIAFASSANQLPSQNFSDAALKAKTRLYINATSGDVGINMGANSPSTSQLQVLTSTGSAYGLFISTAIAGGNSIAISSTSEIFIGGSVGANGQLLTSQGPGLPVKWSTGSIAAVTLSGDSTGTGTSAITVTAAANQPNITTLTNGAGVSVSGSTLAVTGGQSLIEVTDGLSDVAGINIQGTAVSGNGFARGMIGSNFAWNNTLNSWITGNNFGTDFNGIIFRGNGDVAMASSNNNAANTTLSDSQVKALTHFYQTGATGLLGINMGATIPSLSQFQVKGSTTVAYTAYFSTGTTGGFGVDISTTGHFNIFNSSVTQGPTITNGTSDASCSDAACTITASNSPVTFTFAKPYTKVPVCIVTEQTDSVVNALSYSKTATALTITQTGLGGAILDVICVGRD